MVTDREIGKRVKKAIKDSGIKQNTIAEKLNLKKGTMTSYVTGIRHIPEENLKKIAELTGVSVQWLKTGIEDYSAEVPEYRANETVSPHLRLSTQQLKEIMQLKETNPIAHFILNLIMDINNGLSDEIKKLREEVAKMQQENKQKE